MQNFVGTLVVGQHWRWLGGFWISQSASRCILSTFLPKWRLSSIPQDWSRQSLRPRRGWTPSAAVCCRAPVEEKSGRATANVASVHRMSKTDRFSLVTKRLVIGHVMVCQGCCFANTANGKSPVSVDWLKKEWRARGLLKRVQLSICGCLGPCDVPNVVAIADESGTDGSVK